jgi:hypothetical protein
VLAQGRISPADLEMMDVTDDVDTAVRIITTAGERRRSAAPGGGETPSTSSSQPD